MNVYIVTSDDHDYGYGAEIYTYGVYDSEKKANEVVAELNNNSTTYHDAKVIVVTLNHKTCNYLGGYVE